MRHGWLVIAAVWIGINPGWALMQEGSIAGTVVDPLGATVADAAIMLLRDGLSVNETRSGPNGEFAFEGVSAGRYQIDARREGFEPRITSPVFVTASGRVVIEIPLQIGPLQQEIVVTASAAEMPQSRIGSQVTVIDSGTLQALAKPDVLEALRTVPGLQITQTGQRGGTASLFLRGGQADFQKVLVDGVPVNDIGGAFDFSNVASTGIESIEILRGPNSVLYGSDALTGVVSITTPRGRTPQPQGSYSIDGGNLSTIRQESTIDGVAQRFDYFMNFAHFKTDNSLPGNQFQNGTFAGRFGYALGSTNDLSVTVRRARTSAGVPGAYAYHGIADDASQFNRLTFAGLTLQSQLSERWRSTVRLGSMNTAYHFVNPSPTGEPFDPFGFGPNYLGNPVTIEGANGYTVTGRAILDFGGTYPSTFDSRASRWSLYGQTDYRIGSGLDVAGGVRVESEYGASVSTSRSATNRNNAGSFIEARANPWRRFHAHGGVGFDHNAVFGFAATPRVSAALYVRDLSSTGIWGDTKLTFNFGRGIKAPSLFQELSSLYALLQPLPDGPELIAAAGVSPIGPARSRSFDAGIEQAMWGGRARLRASYYHNRFTDQIEFVSKNVLPQLGVPGDVAAATPFGANVNSSSYRAQGLETSADVAIARTVRVAGSYLFLDAVVTESFSSGALSPAINPAFPDIPIGAFSPLVGGRPFRRPTHSGNLVVSYNQGPVLVSAAGYFAGKQDESTFLTDESFGNSLLLPNRDLGFGYQKIDVSGSYRFSRNFRWYTSVENAFNKAYQAAAGFPALSRTVRTGLRITLGGDVFRQ